MFSKNPALGKTMALRETGIRGRAVAVNTNQKVSLPVTSLRAIMYVILFLFFTKRHVTNLKL
jgi:hypothetical protein